MTTNILSLRLAAAVAQEARDRAQVVADRAAGELALASAEFSLRLEALEAAEAIRERSFEWLRRHNGLIK